MRKTYNVPSNHEALGASKPLAATPRTSPGLKDRVLLPSPLGVVVTIASGPKASHCSSGAEIVYSIVVLVSSMI